MVHPSGGTVKRSFPFMRAQKQRGFSWIGCFSYVLVASAYSTRCWRQLGLKRECHKFLLSIGPTSRCTVVSLRGFRSRRDDGFSQVRQISGAVERRRGALQKIQDSGK